MPTFPLPDNTPSPAGDFPASAPTSLRNKLLGVRGVASSGTGGAAAASGGAATGNATAGGDETGASSAGAQGDEGMAGVAALGIDALDVVELESYDGVDDHLESDLASLPGNHLNMQDLADLRERNQLRVRERALRTGDSRAVALDQAGLQILQAAQREIEHAHFSQGAMPAPQSGSLPGLEAMDAARNTTGPLAPFPQTAPDGDDRDRDEQDERPPPALFDLSEAFLDGSVPGSTSGARARLAASGVVRQMANMCAELQATTDIDRGLLQHAQSDRSTLRDIEMEAVASATPAQNQSNEERYDRALNFEIQMQHRLATSIERASKAALVVQNRRIALNHQLRQKMR